MPLKLRLCSEVSSLRLDPLGVMAVFVPFSSFSFLVWAFPSSKPSKNAAQSASTERGSSLHCSYFSSRRSAFSRAETVDFICVVVD